MPAGEVGHGHRRVAHRLTVTRRVKRQGGQLQAGDPPFRAPPEGAGRARVDVEVHRLPQKSRRLLVREAQFRHADFSHPRQATPAGQRELRFNSRGDDQPQILGQPLHQKRDRGIRFRAAGAMIVIQHEHDTTPSLFHRI